MKISAYWAGCDNFGDKLTKEILNCIEGVDVYSEKPQYAKIVGAGSIVNRFEGTRGISYKYPLYVFGAGYNYKKALNQQFMRKLKVYAVRGKYTKEYIERVCVKELPSNVVLGDIGLLVGKLLPDGKVDKEYNLGIIPHYVDEEDSRFKYLEKRICGAKIISVRLEPKDFILELMKCKSVISTAMHPCIACDALRIPNAWCFLPDSKQVDMSHKFNDYYSAFSMEKNAFVLDKEGLESDIIKMVNDKYDITDSMVKNKVEELENALQYMLREIENDKFQDSFWRIVSKGVREVSKVQNLLNK